MSEEGDHLEPPRGVRSCSRSSWAAISRSVRFGFDEWDAGDQRHQPILGQAGKGFAKQCRIRHPLRDHPFTARRRRSGVYAVDVTPGVMRRRRVDRIAERPKMRVLRSQILDDLEQRWLTDRARRSSRTTISVSPALISRSSLDRAGRARGAGSGAEDTDMKTSRLRLCIKALETPSAISLTGKPPRNG